MSDVKSLRAPGSSLLWRAVMLFTNFMCVILAYYQVKVASRSLLLEHGGAEAFPYVWIGSALVLLGFIGIYTRLIANHSRLRVIIASLLLFAVLLVAFHWRLRGAGIATVVAFYIFVDLFSVVLVEQFWSLANSVTQPGEGQKSYWFIATGGLVGGVAGGATASALIEFTPMQTVDLLLSCAALLMLTAAVNLFMERQAMFREVVPEQAIKLQGEGLRAVLANRYLLLIAAIACFSQLVEPLVEYQFLSAIAERFSDTEARSRFIGSFFSVMGGVAIAINVLVTPVLHRYLGTLAGLAAQPLNVVLATCGFVAQPGIMSASVMKIADRGLSYSINRASRETLYINVDPLLTYQAKAWIDMFGYRTFKVFGSGLILTILAFSPAARVGYDLAWLTLLICAFWIAAVVVLGREQQRLLLRNPRPANAVP